MKWVGQHIYDLVSRFRDDVYLEDISTGTIASGGNLGLDSNNKIVKAHPSGDITGVTLRADDSNTVSETSGSADFNILGGRGIDTSVDGTDFVVNGVTASESAKGVVELATTAETTTGTDTGRAVTPDGLKDGYQGSANVTTLGTIGTGVWQGTAIGASYVATLNQDTTGSSGSCTGQAATVATIAGLAPNTATTQATQPNIDSIGTDGDSTQFLGDNILIQNTTANKPKLKLANHADDATAPIIELWNHRIDSSTQAGEDNDVLGNIDFWGYDDTPSLNQYAKIYSDIHDATAGEESGRLTFQVANHDGELGSGLILTGGSEEDEVDATIGLGSNSVVTIPGNIDLAGDIDVDGTLETDALTIGGAAVLAQATASAVGAVELATTGEADTGTDTSRAVTPEGLKSHVDTRYSYAYMTWSASATPTRDGSNNPEWMLPNTAKGIYEEDWNNDSGITSTTPGTTTYSFGRQHTANSLIIPHTGILVGFHAIGRNQDSDLTFNAGLFHADNGLGGAGADGSAGEGIDYGATSASHEYTLRCVATAVETEASGGTDGTTGHSFKGPCKLISNTANLTVQAGDALMPAIMGNSSNSTDEIYVTMTIILKIPLA